MARTTFRRREIVAHAEAAAIAAVDRTLAEAARIAREEHAYENRTGGLEASTQVTEPAHIDGSLHVAGRFGADPPALYVEIGTSRIGPTAVERSREGEMWDIPDPQPQPGVTVRQSFTILPPGTMPGQEEFVTLHQPSVGEGPLMEQRPFLRPAADRENPLLAARLAAAFQGTDLP